MAITSGKGGVGKTSVATNLAIALSRQHHRVCLLDADMGLANVNILLGIQPQVTLDDVIAGNASFADLIVHGPEGLDILPAAASLERMAVQSPSSEAALARALRDLEYRYDYLLVDTPAGIGNTTKAFVHPCDHAALIITPEPTSLTDAFTLLRALLREHYHGEVSVIVNMIPPGQDGQRLFERFRAAAEHHLHVELDYLGAVPMDRSVTRAVLNQSPLLLSAPESAAAMAIEDLGRRLTQRIGPTTGSHRFSHYWAATAEQPAEAPDTPERRSPPAPEPAVGAPEVVTTPEDMREPGPAPRLSLDELGDEAERMLADPDLPESEARRFFGRLERVFTARYKRRAGDIKTLLYESLLHDQLSYEQMREIRDILVETFARRFPDERVPETPSTPRSPATEAPGPSSEPEATLTQLEQLLAGALAGQNWTIEHSRRLLALLDRLHQARFGTLLNAETADRTAEIRALEERFVATRQELQNRLTEICVLIEEHAKLLEEGDDGDR